MKSKTLYRKNSRIGDAKIREIVRCFSIDLTCSESEKFLNLNNKTVQDWFRYIRKAIAAHQEAEKQEIFSGEIEMDESYFGPTRVRGKRGRGTGMKTIVFGLLKRNGKVYTEIVPNVKARTLVPIIRGKVEIGTEVNTDGGPAYDGLVDVGYEKHYRVHHGVNAPQAYTSLSSQGENSISTESNHFGVIRKEDFRNSTESRKPTSIIFGRNRNSGIIAES